MSSGGSRRGLRSFAGKQANAGSAALVYAAATGKDLGGGAEGGSEDSDGFGHYDVATNGAPRRAIRRLRRDELLYKVQDASIRGLPEQLGRLLEIEGGPAWPITTDALGLVRPLPRLDLLDERDTRGRTPLWLAVENAAASKNGVAVLKLLARKGADVDAAAPVKLDQHERDLSDSLLSSCLGTDGASLQKQVVGGCSAFLLATRRGDLHVMRALHELGADVQRADDDGRSPLCVAAASHGGSSNATLQLLLSMGVGLEHSDRCGLTALAFACARGNLYAAGMLMEAGAEKMARDFEGSPPFFHCAKFGHSEMLGEMLERWWPEESWASLLLDTVDSNGRTACHHAASHGEPDAVKALWELAGGGGGGGGGGGHDLLMSEDKDGRTPLLHACCSHFSYYHPKYQHRAGLRIVQMLSSLGSCSNSALLQARDELLDFDPHAGLWCPLLGRQYFEAGLARRKATRTQAVALAADEEEEEEEEEEAIGQQRLAAIWASLEQEVDAGLSHLRPALIDTTGQQAWAEAAVTHLSGRQAIRQWLEMALVVPQSTRAVILCHQRLAWASLAHTRLPGQPPPHRRGRPPAAAPLLLPTDLVEQVAESLPPECRQFARFEVCWQLLIDRRHAWTPEIRACE